MKRKIRPIIAAVLAAAMCAAFTGCGKSNQGLENAANIFGTSSNTNSSNTNNNSNANINSNVNSNAESSAPELQPLDPFADLIVTFTGIVPNSQLGFSGGNNNVSYTASSTSGMKNGDEIVITAELKTPSLKNTYALTETSKTYTVSGLSSYASKLDDIPSDFMSKFDKQAEDVITANTAGWSSGNTMKSLDSIGYYMLSAKEGFNPGTANYLYCVYKVTASFDSVITREEHEQDYATPGHSGEDAYYTFVAFSNILILEDGTCSADLSAGRLCGNSCDSIYGVNSWASFSPYRFSGYKDLDSMFNAVVAKQLESYSYENTVKDVVNTVPPANSSSVDSTASADSSDALVDER